MGILKEGDKIRVKSLKWYKDNCDITGGVESGVETEGNTFVSDMRVYCGKEAIITNYISDTEFYIDIDDNEWGWTIEMVEVVKEPIENYYNDVFKFGDFYVKVNTRNKIIYPEFFNTCQEAEDYEYK